MKINCEKKKGAGGEKKANRKFRYDETSEGQSLDLEELFKTYFLEDVRYQDVIIHPEIHLSHITPENGV